MSFDFSGVGYLIAIIFWGFIWAFVTSAVISNKGYDSDEDNVKWFWLGFFFGFFATIVAATKPSKITTQQTNNSTQVRRTTIEDIEKLAKLKEQGVLTEEEYNKMKSDLIDKV